MIDAAARNYNVAVIMDCVFDRIEISHRVALLDLWMKYTDIFTYDEAMDDLQRVEVSY